MVDPAGTALKKSDLKASLEEFRRSLRHLIEHDHLPNYRFEFTDDTDIVIFPDCGTMSAETHATAADDVPLRGDTYDAACQAAPGCDVYALEQDWPNLITEPPSPRQSVRRLQPTGAC